MFRIVDHTGTVSRFTDAGAARKALIRAVRAMVAGTPCNFGAKQLELAAATWDGASRNRTLGRPIPGAEQRVVQIGGCD